MRYYGKITEIFENTPGIWYVRWSHIDDTTGDTQTDYFKFKQAERPTATQVRDLVLPHLYALNNPPALIPLIPELAPEIEGMNASQKVALSLIWTFLKVWIRQLIGRQ